MSKVNAEILANAVSDMLKYSKGEKIVHNGEERTGKVRNFTESIELQISTLNARCDKFNVRNISRYPHDKRKKTFCGLYRCYDA